jgi:hypothetical protein
MHVQLHKNDLTLHFLDELYSINAFMRVKLGPTKLSQSVVVLLN